MNDINPMAEVAKRSERPDDVRAQLIELVSGDKIVSAIKVYRDYHGVGLADAKRAIECLHGEVAPSRQTCPCCGKPLRTALAQQCLECGADWHGKGA